MCSGKDAWLHVSGREIWNVCVTRFSQKLSLDTVMSLRNADVHERGGRDRKRETETDRQRQRDRKREKEKENKSERGQTRIIFFTKIVVIVQSNLFN